MAEPWYIQDMDTRLFWCRTRGWVPGPELTPSMEYKTHAGALRAANRMLEKDHIRGYIVIKLSKLQQEIPSCTRVRA